MIIFIVLLGIIGGLIRSILSALLVSSSTIYGILALGVFISVPLMLMNKTRSVGLMMLLSIVLCYAGYDVIASYPLEIAQLSTISLTIIATFFVKRKMWQLVTADALRATTGGICYLKHPWMRWVVRLI